MSIWCKLGKHKWNEWTYEGRGSCLQNRKCNRCSRRQQRTEHKWGKWQYKSAQSCIKVRFCLRCNQPEGKKPTTDEDHSWSEWNYETSTSCIQRRHCLQCEKEQTYIPAEKDHKWSKWDYESPSSCFQTRYCLRCSEKQTQKPQENDHKWGNWTYHKGTDTDCKQIRVCQQCNETQQRIVLHEWSKIIEYSRDKKSCHDYYKKCLRCGHERKERSATPYHDWSGWEIFREEKQAIRICKNCGKKEVDDLRGDLKKG